MEVLAPPVILEANAILTCGELAWITADYEHLLVDVLTLLKDILLWLVLSRLQ